MQGSGTSVTASAGGTLTLGGDLEVNRMGFGAMRLTGPGIWGEPADREECKAVLRRCIDLDMNFVDTADSYGPEVSERLICEALYPYPDGLVIATKGGQTRPGPGKWVPNGRPDHLRAALEGSLRRLRLDTIDLYQFHRPDPKVPFEESVGFLARMRDEGKIRHVGLSNVSTEQLAQAQQIVPIDSVQNWYNAAARESEDVLQACEQAGIAFIPWGPLAQGQLLESEDSGAAICQRHNATGAQIALAWLLHHSPVMLLIPGTSKVSHLEENVAAAAITLSDDETRELAEAEW